jgi:hypothetical protein
VLAHCVEGGRRVLVERGGVLGQVLPHAEGPAGAGQDDGPHLVVVGDVPQGRQQPLLHGQAQRRTR